MWFCTLLQENGLLHVPKGQTQNAQAQMFSDPNMAMDMMKKNLSMIIPQVKQLMWCALLELMDLLCVSYKMFFKYVDPHFCLGELLLLWIRGRFVLSFGCILQTLNWNF